MFKYRCRECPVQDECIEQSDTATGAKIMIRNAFAARTDTVSTWGVLQKNCLLLQEDRERERRQKEGSLLGRRLRKARAAKDEPPDEEPGDGEVEPAEPEPEPSIIKPHAIVTGESDAVEAGSAFDTSTADLAQLEASAGEMSETGGQNNLNTHALDPAQVEQPSSVARLEPRWLVVAESQRHIALPLAGELVLGRFDPALDDPLDVDLTYDDRESLSVSRRHARIVVSDEQYLIEDLNSSNGVVVNGVRLEPGATHLLRPGDSVAVGVLEMQVERVPPDFVTGFISRATEIYHYLFLTHTGRKIEIAPPNNITIGRLDEAAGFVPTVDLSPDGPVATSVSRRHAIITWRKQIPCLRDLESTFGTRLNGQELVPDQVVGLKPGDHISLGGCVLAYEIEN
jgi:pSer/pThr/pTyr-binding forkhead associated (FHA) protein